MCVTESLCCTVENDTTLSVTYTSIKSFPEWVNTCRSMFGTRSVGQCNTRPCWLPWVLNKCGGSDGKESACHATDPGLISGWGRSPGDVNANPLQYSCLENSMNRVRHDWATLTSLEGVEKGGEDGIQTKSTGVPFSNSQMELALISIQENKNKIKTWPGMHSPLNLPSLPQPHALSHPSFSFPVLLSSLFPFSILFYFPLFPCPFCSLPSFPPAPFSPLRSVIFIHPLSPLLLSLLVFLPAHVSQAGPIDIAPKPGKPDPPLLFVPLPLRAPSYAKGRKRWRQTRAKK